MQNIEGLYTALASLIKDREASGKLAIDVKALIEDVKSEVDVHSASLDWYVKTALSSAAECALWRSGYRSVKKGEGLFVNADHCTNKAYLARLFNNAKLSEMQKKQVAAFLAKKIKTLGFNGQLSLDLETGLITEDVTEEQLLEMLRKDAESIA